jgi:hypothetical protein
LYLLSWSDDQACGLAFTCNGSDETSGVNLSDAMIGALGDKDAAALADSDLLRRQQPPVAARRTWPQRLTTVARTM